MLRQIVQHFQNTDTSYIAMKNMIDNHHKVRLTVASMIALYRSMTDLQEQKIVKKQIKQSFKLYRSLSRNYHYCLAIESRKAVSF